MFANRGSGADPNSFSKSEKQRMRDHEAKRNKETDKRIFSALKKEHEQAHWGKGEGNKGGDTK